jgi:hypothetical protein
MNIEDSPEFRFAVLAEELAQKTEGGEGRKTPKIVVRTYIVTSVKKQNAKTCQVMEGEELISYVKSALVHFAKSVYSVKNVRTFGEGGGTVKMDIEDSDEFRFAVLAEELAQKKEGGEAPETAKNVVRAYIVTSVKKQNAKTHQVMEGEELINYVKSALVHFGKSVYSVKTVRTFGEGGGTVKQVREFQIQTGHKLTSLD